jgi:hypothetical protein
MEPHVVATLFLLLSAAPTAAREAEPYQVFFHATPNESLCALLPGRPMKITVPPSLDRWKTQDRLEVSCDETTSRGAPQVWLKFWLEASAPAQAFDFRWGQQAGATTGVARGQFAADPALCLKVASLIEAIARTPPSATIHLINAKLTVACSPDARWGTSLELHLALNQQNPPLTPEQALKLLRPPSH